MAVIHSGTDTVHCDICGYNYRTLIRTEKSNVQSCFNCFHREFGKERTIEMVRENPQKEFGDYYVRGGFEPVVDDEAVSINGITIRLAFEYFIWLSNKLHNDQFANDFSFGETHFNDEINFRQWGIEYTAYPFAFDKFIAMEVIDRIQHMTFKECTRYLDQIKNTKGSDDHKRSPPLAEAFSQIVVHQNIEHLKDKYGLCPSCRERPLDTKLEGHIHEGTGTICTVCQSRKVYMKLLTLGDGSRVGSTNVATDENEQEYNNFYNEAKKQNLLPSTNFLIVKDLMQLCVLQKTPSNIIENALMNKFHKIERHYVNQWGWCKICNAHYRRGYLPKGFPEKVKSCQMCLNIIDDPVSTNQDIAVPLRKHIKKHHPDLFKIVENPEEFYYQWNFISPEGEEERVTNKFRRDNPDATVDEYDEFVRNRLDYITRSYILGDEGEMEIDGKYKLQDQNSIKPHDELKLIFQNKVWSGGIRNKKDDLKTAENFVDALRSNDGEIRNWLKDRGGSDKWVDSLLDKTKNMSEDNFILFQKDFAEHLSSKKEIERTPPKHIQKEMVECQGCHKFAELYRNKKLDEESYHKHFNEHLIDSHPEFFLYVGKGVDKEVNVTVNNKPNSKGKYRFDLPLQQTKSDLDLSRFNEEEVIRGGESDQERKYRFADPNVEEFSLDFSKFLQRVLDNPIKFKSKFKKYTQVSANQIIHHIIEQSVWDLHKDGIKFQKKEAKDYGKKIYTQAMRIDLDKSKSTKDLENYLDELRKETKVIKKRNNRTRLIHKCCNEMRQMIAKADDDIKLTSFKDFAQIESHLWDLILKRYSFNEDETKRVKEFSLRLINQDIKNKLKSDSKLELIKKKLSKDSLLNSIKRGTLEDDLEGTGFKPSSFFKVKAKPKEIETKIDDKIETMKDLSRPQTDDELDNLIKSAENSGVKPEKIERLKEYAKLHKEMISRQPVTQNNTYKKKPDFVTFDEFKVFMKENDIFSKLDYENYQKGQGIEKGYIGLRLPKSPESVFKKDWKGWRVASGLPARKPALTQEIIEGIKQEIKDNWDFYTDLEEGFILYIFDQWGVFGIKDPIERAWFNEFVKWKDIPKKQNAIWDYLNIGDKNIIKERIITSADKTVETEFEFHNRQFSQTVHEIPLFESDTETIEEIIQKSDHYLPTIKNDKINKFIRLKFIKNLWISFFDNPKQDLSSLQKNGLEFHDQVIGDFERQYGSVTNDQLQHWRQYKKFYQNNGKKPYLLQFYGAFMLLTVQGLLNMFGTGTGKTLTAILGSKVINAKHVFWICPKNTIDQTKSMMMDAFPEVSEVTTVLDDPKNKEIPKEFFDNPAMDGHINKKNGKYITKYHIINYEQFSLKSNAENLLSQLLGKKIELFVLDESQLVKNRNESEEKASNRRKKIIELLIDLRKQNPNMRVLMLSATPIVNNVIEFMSLYKMISGIDLSKHGMSGYTNIKNGARMFVECQPFSIRYEAKYDIEVLQPITKCEGHLPDEMSDETARQTPFIDFESFLTGVRIPYMLKKFREIREKNPNEKLVIYTHYVGSGIIDQLQVAFRDAGYRTGVFYGEEKSGWVNQIGVDNDGKPIFHYPFKEGKLDVLIAGRTFQIGVDGAQNFCKNIFFNGFVWTDTEFEQIKGRLIRGGQNEKKVYVHMFFATIDGFQYDHEVKYLRVLRKRAMGDLCKDGRLPKDVALGEEKEKEKAIEKMLDNRRSGFPTKEKLKQMHAKEAEIQVKTELEELKKEYPKAQFDLGDDNDE